MKMVTPQSLGVFPEKTFDEYGLHEPDALVPDLRPGDMLRCVVRDTFSNAWCRNYEENPRGLGCGKCCVIFLGYNVSRPPYEDQIWGHICWQSWEPGRIDSITPRALDLSFELFLPFSDACSADD